MELSAVLNLPLEALILASVLFALLFATSVLGVAWSVRRYLKGRDADLKLRGPLWFWLQLLTRAPSLVLLSSLGVPCYLSFAALRAIDYDIAGHIDMDVSSYYRADSDLTWTENAVDAAVDQHEGWWDGEARRLSSVRRWLWTIDLFYEAHGNETVFNAAALDDINRFERSIVEFPGYERHCQTHHPPANRVEDCLAHDTILNILRRSEKRAGDDEMLIKYDGLGSMVDVRPALQELAIEGVFWWPAKEFNYNNLVSRYTRSRFQGYVYGFRTNSTWLLGLYERVLKRANDGAYPHVVISYYSAGLRTWETMEVLGHDCVWSIGAFCIVFLLMVLKLRSIVLSVAAILGVLLAFTSAFYYYHVIAGFQKMTLLNFVALFLVTGIAADDVFVMYSEFRLSSSALALRVSTSGGRGGGPVSRARQRMEWTYYRAGSAMLVTTATTCGSFYALQMSSLMVIRAFGFYMGTIILLNYIHVMTIFSSTLLLHAIFEEHCARHCCCSRRESDRADDVMPSIPYSADMSREPTVDGYDTNQTCMTKCFRGPFASMIFTMRTIVILALCVLASFCAVRAALDIKGASSIPQIFSPTHNLGRIQALTTEVFASYDFAALTDVRTQFSSQSWVARKVCPLGLLVDNESVPCSGRGWCESEATGCECQSGYIGFDCSFERMGATLTVSNSVQVVAILSAAETSGKILKKQFMIYNRGDVESEWNVSSPSKDWISITSVRSGVLAPRVLLSNGRYVPSSVEVDLEIDLRDKTVGWSDVGIVQVTRSKTSDEVQQGTHDVRVSARTIRSPELLSIRLLPNHLTLSPSFGPARRAYIAELPFRTSSVMVLPEFASPVEASAVNGVLVPPGGGVPLSNFSVGTPQKAIIEAMISSLDVNGTYEVVFERLPAKRPGAPWLQRVVAGNRSIEVLFAPPANDGGDDVIAYKIEASAEARRLDTSAQHWEEVPCQAADCWTHSTGFQPGKKCCQHILRVANDRAYTVAVVAITKGGGEGWSSVPKLTKNSADGWCTVVPSETSVAPVLARAPKVYRHHREVELFIDRSAIVAGGAVPLGRFVCTSNPEGRRIESMTGDGIVIKGLNASKNYTFSCTFRNARLNEDGVADRSVPSQPTPSVRPEVLPPPPPSILVVRIGRKDELVVATGISDEYAVLMNCSLWNQDRSDVLQASERFEEATAALRQVTLRFPGWQPSMKYQLQCWATNRDRGRAPDSPVDVVGKSSDLLSILPVPARPAILSTKAVGSGKLEISYEWSSDSSQDPGLIMCQATKLSQASDQTVREIKYLASMVIDGLVDGETYTVSCLVKRALVVSSPWIVESLWSDESNPVVVGTKPPSPGSPLSLDYVPATSTVSVTIQDVSHVPPVLRYFCIDVDEPLNNGSLDVMSPSSKRTINVKMLDSVHQARPYSFACAASNAVGDSALGPNRSFSVTSSPTNSPSAAPTVSPSAPPTFVPTPVPTQSPTSLPTTSPTVFPTLMPTQAPTFAPSLAPTQVPTNSESESFSDVLQLSIQDDFNMNTPDGIAVLRQGISQAVGIPLELVQVAFNPFTDRRLYSDGSGMWLESQRALRTEAIPSDSSRAGRLLAKVERVYFRLRAPPGQTSEDVENSYNSMGASSLQTAINDELAKLSMDPVIVITAAPTPTPTATPTEAPTEIPTLIPTASPTQAPTTAMPTVAPTVSPTLSPTSPTQMPTLAPTVAPTVAPSKQLLAPEAPVILEANWSGGQQATVKLRPASGAGVIDSACIAFALDADGDEEGDTGLGANSTTEVVVLRALSAGTRYRFRCRSRNAAGSSNFSDASDPPTLIPSPPQPPTVADVSVDGDRALTLQLRAPATDGGLPLAYFFCEALMMPLAEETSSKGAPPPNATTTGNSSSLTFRGLEAGKLYTFRCAAANDLGLSPWSPVSSPAVRAVLAPQPPMLACLRPENNALTALLRVSSANLKHASTSRISCTAFAVGEDDAALGAVLARADADVETASADASGDVELAIRLADGKLQNGVPAKVACEALAATFAPVSSATSMALTPGIPVVATYELVGDGIVFPDDLRRFLAEALNVQLSRVMAELVPADGGDLNGCQPLQQGTSTRAADRRLQTSAVSAWLLQVKVLMRTADDPAIEDVVLALSALPLSTGRLAQRTRALEIRTVAEPAMASEAFVDSSLKQLEFSSSQTVESPACDPCDTLVPTFDPARKVYAFNASGARFSLHAEARSRLAFPVLARLSDESEWQVLDGRDFAITAVAPLWELVQIRVKARDRSTTTYYVKVFFQSLRSRCPSDCVDGECNEFTGACECFQGYFGSSCKTYCPGTPICNGRGSCSQALQGCSCNSTWGGSACNERVCPTCLFGGTCVPGDQDAVSKWACSCLANRSGDTCESVTCPNDCSNAGDCISETGTCSCYPGFQPPDCRQREVILAPINKCIEVTLVLGLKGYTTYQAGEPVYDAAFNFSDAVVQQWFLDVVRRARSEPQLLVRGEQTTWIESFESYVRSRGTFPVSNQWFSPLLLEYFSKQAHHRSDVGAVVAGEDVQVRYVRARFKINVLKTVGTSALGDVYARWATFLTEVNAEAPLGLRVLMVSTHWSRMELEQGILDSTVRAFIVSVGLIAAFVLLFSGNLMIVLITVLNSVLMIATLFGFIISWLQWEFGAVEAISITTLVGMNVDYALHICHAYLAAPESTRKAKVADSLMHVGGAVLGGALTTIGSSTFLLPAWIYFFYQLGVFLLVNTCIAITFAFFFVSPLLMCCGPLGASGDLFSCCFCCCRRSRRGGGSRMGPDEGTSCNDSEWTLHAAPTWDLVEPFEASDGLQPATIVAVPSPRRSQESGQTTPAAEPQPAPASIGRRAEGHNAEKTVMSC
eukprot:TRINITY_DN20952_c0_g4_i1.p1 TRINITY_DN20952_c0_g4~~TRINITY_DN20952_c0_g4_i1.p1  ORF type:complete len:2857 (-),score=361.22 TRINITY_DN20952_c0_g4_i1:92-8662(-)